MLDRRRASQIWLAVAVAVVGILGTATYGELKGWSAGQHQAETQYAVLLLTVVAGGIAAWVMLDTRDMRKTASDQLSLAQYQNRLLHRPILSAKTYTADNFALLREMTPEESPDDAYTRLKTIVDTYGWSIPVEKRELVTLVDNPGERPALNVTVVLRYRNPERFFSCQQSETIIVGESARLMDITVCGDVKGYSARQFNAFYLRAAYPKMQVDWNLMFDNSDDMCSLLLYEALDGTVYMESRTYRHTYEGFLEPRLAKHYSVWPVFEKLLGPEFPPTVPES